MIVSKLAIAREYEVIRKHEEQAKAIEWTAAKLSITEQPVVDVVDEREEVEA